MVLLELLELLDRVARVDLKAIFCIGLLKTISHRAIQGTCCNLQTGTYELEAMVCKARRCIATCNQLCVYTVYSTLYTLYTRLANTIGIPIAKRPVYLGSPF